MLGKERVSWSSNMEIHCSQLKALQFCHHFLLFVAIPRDKVPQKNRHRPSSKMTPANPNQLDHCELQDLTMRVIERQGASVVSEMLCLDVSCMTQGLRSVTIGVVCIQEVIIYIIDIKCPYPLQLGVQKKTQKSCSKRSRQTDARKFGSTSLCKITRREAKSVRRVIFSRENGDVMLCRVRLLTFNDDIPRTCVLCQPKCMDMYG